MKVFNRLFILLAIILGMGLNTYAQDNHSFALDSLRVEPDYIELSDIPLKSSELRVRLEDEIQNMISDNALRELNRKNSSAISGIDKSLLISPNPANTYVNIRFLENRIARLSFEKNKVDALSKEFSSIISSLDEFRNKLNRETRLWRNTITLIEQDTLSKGIPVKLTETVAFLDSTTVLINFKIAMILEILEKTVPVSAEIDNEIENCRALILIKQTSAFEADNLPFFNQNFDTGYRMGIWNSYKNIKKDEFTELSVYLRSRINAVIFTFILFGVFIYLLILIRKKALIQYSGDEVTRQGAFFKLLSHPVSTGLILTIYASMVVLPFRPVILRELSFYIVVFPLIYILRQQGKKEYQLYIMTFGLLMLFFMMLFPFPNESFIYRLILLLISLVEVLLLTLFLFRFEKWDAFTALQKSLVKLFIYSHLLFAVTGLLSNITGRITLTEIMLRAVFINILHGITLYLAALAITGFFATGVDSPNWQRLNIFRLYGRKLKIQVSRITNFIAVFLWITFVLHNFGIKDQIFSAIGSFITSEIKVGSARFSLDFILIFFLIIYVSIVVANMIKILLEEEILVRIPVSKGLPHSLAMLAKYALIAIGFLLASYAAGIPLSKLTIILGALSVGIGFGLQNIFNNLVSGLILLYERPIQHGDTVQVGQLTGNVKNIGLRSSNLVTFDGAEVIVPNGQLVSNEVINWTLSDPRRRLELNIGVSYESDPEIVYRLLIEIFKNHQEVLREPEPMVLFNGLGASSLDFRLLFWVENFDLGLSVKSEVLFRIFKVFRENGIKIPYPQQELHINPSGLDILLKKSGEEEP